MAQSTASCCSSSDMSAFLMPAFQTVAVASGAPLVTPPLRFWGVCFQGLGKLGRQSPTTCTGTLQRTGNTANTSSPAGRGTHRVHSDTNKSSGGPDSHGEQVDHRFARIPRNVKEQRLPAEPLSQPAQAGLRSKGKRHS